MEVPEIWVSSIFSGISSDLDHDDQKQKIAESISDLFKQQNMQFFNVIGQDNLDFPENFKLIIKPVNPKDTKGNFISDATGQSILYLKFTKIPVVFTIR